MDRRSRICVAGTSTFIGSAICRELKRDGYMNTISRHHNEPNLLDRTAVNTFFTQEKPEYVFLVAGKSAGIIGNIKYPADLMLDNLLVECHVIDAAYQHGVKKLLYLASNCCYPRHCAQPMKESSLLTGTLEPTNEPYAVAKIAGIKLVQSYRKQHGANFICGIPANTFGLDDDFDPEDSHVVGALIFKLHEAKQQDLKEVVIWGTGKPRREFMYVDDLAKACVLVMHKYDDIEPVNIGPGGDVSIAELASVIKEIVGFSGKLVFDSTKQDGMPVKLLDTNKLGKLGWRPSFSIAEGLRLTYAWYCSNIV